MPDNIVNTRIKLATKSDSDWSTLNPTLLSGEVGLDSTNKLIYVGDGTTAFNSLTAWNLLPTNLVTTDTNQNITGTKTFVGTKKIAFKQSGSSDKLGFTLYNSGGTEKGYLEYNPTNLIDGYPLMTIGNYATSASGITQVGFRRYSGISGANGAYNLLMPLIADAKTPFSLTTTYTNFYLPLGFKNGSTMVTTAKSGVVDLGSLIPTPTVQVQADWTQTDNTEVDYIKNKPTLATVATSGDYDDLTNKPTIPAAQVQSDWTQSDNTQVDYIKNKPTLATVATTGAYSDLSGTPNLATVATSGSYTDLTNTPMEIPTITTGDEGKVLTVNSTEDGVEWTDIPSELPTISSGDAGKALVVNSGETGVEWDTVSGLPPVTSSNNGDTLEVVDGDWAVTDTLATTDDRLYNVEDMILNNRFFAPIATDAQTATLIVTDDDEAILSDWGLYVDGNDFVNVVNDNSTTNKISSTKIDWTDAPKELPDIESGDEGKVLTVNSTEDGVEWSAIPSNLPSVTSSDEGKILTVDSSGDWIASSVLGSYLPLSGGTMTGAINLIDSSSVLNNNKFTLRDRIFGTVNLIDVSSIEQGDIGSSGADEARTTRLRTGFAKVSPNTTYIASKPSGILLYSFVYYDARKNFVRKITPGASLPYTITTGATEEYVRIVLSKSDTSATIALSDVSWVQLEKGSSASDSMPYALDNVELTNRRFVQNWESKNLIDQASLEQGTLVDGDGTEYPATTRLRSGFSSVDASTTYTISMTSGVTFIYVFFYDASKAFISKTAYIDTAQSTFTTPSGCAYVRVNIHYTNDATILPSAVSNLQLEKGSQASFYMPYALDNIELTKRVVPDYSTSENGKVLGVSSGKLVWVNNSGGGGTYYAGDGLALDNNTFRTSVIRVTTDANTLPNINTFRIREYNGTSSNLPTSHWYHIYEAKGADGNYGTQLALGMTTNQAYYRSYQNGWQSWRKLDNNMYGTNFYSGGQNDQTHDCNSMTYNGHWYYDSNGPSTALGMVSTDGGLYSQFHSINWGGQIAQDYRYGKLCVRGRNAGSWMPWEAIPFSRDMLGLTVTANNIKIEPLHRRISANKSTNAWDSQAYSEVGYASSCYVAFKPAETTKAIMAGLDSNPAESASYENIDYCWYFRTDGKADIYESNTCVSLNRAFSAGDDFRIEYDGTLVRYYHNGSLVREVSRAIGSSKMYFDSCFYSADCSIYDYSFGPSTIATNTLVNAIKAVRGASISTSTSGCWTAMCNSDSTGSPTLPTTSQWWHVLSLDWTGNDTSSWVSQLALPTQQNLSIYYRRNATGGSGIDNADWVKVLDDRNYSSYAVPLTGGHMSGPLIVSATGAQGSYDEGIRINAGKNGYSTLLLGGTANTTTSTNDGSWWIGCNSQTISTNGRKLYIAHYGSTNSSTYFHVPNSSVVSPYLQLGSSGSVANGDYNAVNGNAVYSWLANNMSVAATGNRLVQRSAEGYIYGVYYNQSSNVEDNLFSGSCNIMYSGSDSWVRKVSWPHLMSNYLFPVFTRGDGPSSVTSNDSRVIIDEGSYMVHKFGWASNATGVVTVTIRLHSTADTGTRIYFATLPKPAAPVGILPFSYNTGKVANAAWYYLSTDGRLSNTGAIYAGEPHCLTFSYVSATNEFA